MELNQLPRISIHKIKQFLTRFRRYLGLLIILATLVAFIWYIKVNPSALNPLRSTPIYFIPVFLLLYGAFLLTNVAITVITIKISKKTYPIWDSFMLTIYSTLVNFFGPLQSGPGFRAIFLKKKIGLSIKDYTLATMLYYGAFLAISLLMMFGINYPAYTLIGIVCLGLVGLWFFRSQNFTTLMYNFAVIAAITCVQLLIVTIIYYIELVATGSTPTIPEALTYTGSANLALFVSFTPGAIGIRESFIIFSQNLHNIPTENIISASLLDRSVYLIFLGILFIFSSYMHLSKKLKTK